MNLTWIYSTDRLQGVLYNIGLVTIQPPVCRARNLSAATTNTGQVVRASLYTRPGHDVKLHPHFHCHWQLFVLMCHEAGHSAFLHTQSYFSTNLDHILFSNVSWH